ncbi:MAG TPA: TonB-dependent receptor, partial [Thermoanaerobaculia bacterium]|nr:TonB-dependent receptor [Thermoanaerobaculia bacterium]
MKTLRFRALALAGALLLMSLPAAAQLQTGNLYGTVTDQQGVALPGVTATLSGQGAPQIQVTNAQGQFRFLNLSPGGYALKAELEGFSTIDYPNISINVGRNTTIEVTLQAAVEDVITVTAESPLLDERRISTGATVASTELEKIPTARDPWAILQTTPGVLTDRINVGGNQSGQQSQYVGPGSSMDQAVWSVDGVVITDMAALGSSPAYYDFDSFEEMQVSTGGSDSTMATPGVSLNMVTKRGTNEWRGSGRYLKAELEGFSTIDYPNIVINVDRNTSIEVTLQAAVEDVITVTAESPLLDERRISTGATIASTELEKIPTARDPWAILQ